MKAPKFWQKPSSIFAVLLQPVGGLYNFFSKYLRQKQQSYQSKIPVICCGNITLGGTGKTPTVIALGRYLQAQGKKVCFLTRGWKGSVTAPTFVDCEEHTFQDVGDEALLLVHHAPTVVAVDRAKGAQLIEAELPDTDFIIMDDGFQNSKLHKDVAILVFDGAVGLGNGQIFPAGPLREKLQDGLKRAQAVLMVGEDKTNLIPQIKVLAPEIQILSGELKPTNDTISESKKYLAFAGIGRPEKFFESLRALGAAIVRTQVFADHHAYTLDEESLLQKKADELGAQLITTEKDAVRLSPQMKEQVQILSVQLQTDFSALKLAGII